MSSVQVVGKSKRHLTENADIISNLPPNVTQHILELLPLQEAVRTSILSTNWRHRWSSISQLILDKQFFTSILKRKIDISDVSLTSYSDIINNICLSHRGSITKFVIYLPLWFMKETDINQWIRLVRGKGVKEWTLEDGRGPEKILPTCLFSCVSLTHLTLMECKLPCIPATFKGFLCLTSLKWEMCSSSITGKTSEVLEYLISKCPMLESLDVIIFENIDLTIRAPKLLHFCMVGYVKSLCLEETNVIKTLVLDMPCRVWRNSSRDMRKFFSCLAKVERLILSASFWTAARCYTCKPNEKFSKKLQKLLTLKLVEIPLDHRNSISFALCLFRSSPNIKGLHIKASKRKFDDQLVEIDDSYKLPRLENVEILGISWLTTALQLIRFLLACSPILKTMTIELSAATGCAEEKFNLAKELMRCSRASPNAEIILKTKKI